MQGSDAVLNKLDIVIAIGKRDQSEIGSVIQFYFNLKMLKVCYFEKKKKKKISTNQNNNNNKKKLC